MSDHEDEAPVEVSDWVVGYGGPPVLRGVDLSLPAGATTVLLGRNGAGKTTLLRSLLGLLSPTSGRARVLGMDPWRERSKLAARVSYVPDRPDVWPWMRVADVARLLAPHFDRWDEKRLRDGLERFDVPRDARFRALSRGQAMKASIAFALAIDPPLLLMDEPFGGLDPIARDEVLEEVIGAVGERRRTVFVSTHETAIAARIGDGVVVLRSGRLGGILPMDEVLHAPTGPRGPDALAALLAPATEEVSS